MNHVKLYAVAALLILSAACKKSRNNDTEPQKEPQKEPPKETVKLPSVHTIISRASGTDDSTLYQYDRNGRCTSYYRPLWGTTQITYTYHRAVEIFTDLAGKKNKVVYYLRNGSMLSDTVLYIRIHAGVESVDEVLVFSYNREEQPTQLSYYNNIGALVQSYKYTWKDGNLVEIAPDNTGATAIPTRKFSYDLSKLNTMRVNRPVGETLDWYLSKNLATESVLDLPNGSNITEQYTYAYDDSGWVAKRTVLKVGDQREFIYRYK